MYIEIVPVSAEKGGQANGVVRWDGDRSLDVIEQDVRKNGLTSLAFVDHEFFADIRKARAMCESMREQDINILWSARMATVPTDALLKSMRLAGCQYLDMQLEPDKAVTGMTLARRYGFDVRLQNTDGSPYASDRLSYSVAERERIAERLAGLHAAQFDLAVAYYKAHRYEEVMLPLGKAMTLRFPANELCLNLLACLSAARQYPERAAGLLDQARHGCPHPVVFRNRELLKSWLASGGNLKGARLDLEPAEVSSRT